MSEPPKPNTADKTSSASRLSPSPGVEDAVDTEQPQRNAQHQQDRQVGGEEQEYSLHVAEAPGGGVKQCTRSGGGEPFDTVAQCSA